MDTSLLRQITCALVALCYLTVPAPTDTTMLRHIGRTCMVPRLPSDVFSRICDLGICRPPTKRGTRAGRLHRLWHNLPPAPADLAGRRHPTTSLPLRVLKTLSPAPSLSSSPLSPLNPLPDVQPSTTASSRRATDLSSLTNELTSHLFSLSPLPLPTAPLDVPPETSPSDTSCRVSSSFKPPVTPSTTSTPVSRLTPFQPSSSPALSASTSVPLPPSDSPPVQVFSDSFSHFVNLSPSVFASPCAPPQSLSTSQLSHQPALSDNKLSLCLFNSQSVCKDGKADTIADFVIENNLDIMFITETWLRQLGDEPITASLTPRGYRLASYPRPSRGGGIAVLYKDSLHSRLSFSQSLPFSHPSFEFVEICLKLSGQSVTFSCLYRPPPSTENKLTTSMFFSDFDQLLDHYSLLPGKLVILGDMNVHFDDPDRPDTKRICNTLSNHNLTQYITQPTHRHGHTLDWIISRQSDNFVLATDVSLALPSDHSAILCSLDLSPPSRTKRIVTRRNLKSINLTDFNSEASHLLSETSLDPAKHFDSSLRQLLNSHAPPSTRFLPDRPPAPWLTPEIAQAKRARRRAERRWRDSKLTVHRQIFQAARSKVSDLIASAKNSHFQNKIINATSSKELYSTMNDLLGASKDSPLPTTHPLNELPSVFSSFFSSKIQDIRDKLDKTPCQPCSTDPLFSGTPMCTFRSVSQDEVMKTIKSMSFKTCDLDPLPTSLYSDCLPHLLPFITDIINSSLSTGTVPDSFKSAIVRPLLKKHNLDPNELKNYRPVSNLSFLSKLLEKIVLNQLNTHLSSNNLLNPFQSAYRQHHSTETALLHILNDLLLATDSGKVSLLTLLDLSAAFDTIDHSILLSRLQHSFGISSTALSWFSSYLSFRNQTVLINNISSDPVQLTCGVPQGSVLGPVLFTLYTSPLSNIINSHQLKHHFYADDSQLQDSDTPDNVQSLLTRTSDCYTDIKNWMTHNKLQLNDDKTEAMLIGTRQKLSQLSPSPCLSLSNSTIVLSDSAKNLGVTLDNTLSMHKFVTTTAKACYFHLRRISQIRKHLSTEATTKLVISLVLSRIDYCNSLLSGLPDSTINILQRVQNSAARLILKKKKSDHISPLLATLHWLPVSKRIQYKLNTLSYKCLNNSAPHYLSNNLHIYTPSRSLRSQSDPLCLRVPRTKLSTFGPRSFTVSAPLTWNKLPLSIRQQPTLPSFKTSLKTHMFNL